ncbi:immunoglobulin-like domain-containing protein [Bacillus sp. EAC]|uniref:immunoglobulin-like domain-containing protein n=1 Tax=Bacillus sp. EAC TaxID=1978338 RepID=UPI000B44EF68|nr:immunoglobulin-like domain-containing protein [Bacillus sp. EAC]
MKKSWFLIVFGLFCFLSACSTNSDEHVFSQKIFQSFVDSPDNTIPDTIQDGAIQISMILDGQYYPSGTKDLTLSIVNNGDSLFYGTPYSIERFDEKRHTWREIPFRKDFGFDQIGLTINQSEIKDEKITIGSARFSKPLEPGFYRVIKSFSTNGDKSVKISAIFQLL